MPKKIKLDLTFCYKDITIAGIHSHLPDYRLVWGFNNIFKFNFVKANDFCFVPLKEEKPVPFSCFQYHDEINFKKYFLLSNKFNNHNIVNEYKMFDYLLIVKGNLNENQTNEMLAHIKDMKQVLLCKEIDFSKIKSFDIIMNDFEIFVSEINKK